MRNALAFFVLIMIAGGCKSSLSEQYSEFVFEKSERASLQPVYIGGEYLLYTDKLLVYNDYLVNINTKSDVFFDVLKLADLQYIGTCGNKGRGPEEFKFINTKCSGIYNGQFYIMEPRRYSIFDIFTRNDSLLLHKCQRTALIPELNVSNSMAILDDTTFIINSGNKNFDEFYRYNPKTFKFVSVGKYSEFHPQASIIPSDATGTIYLNKTFLNTKTKQLAAIYSYLPMVKIFEPSMQLSGISLLSMWKEQVFDYADGGVNINNSYIYYIDACASDDYIYGLYIGETTSDLSQKNPQTLTPRLHIWDWNGRPVKSLELDKFVNKMTVDKFNTIYATSFLVADSVYRLNIKNL